METSKTQQMSRYTRCLDGSVRVATLLPTSWSHETFLPMTTRAKKHALTEAAKKLRSTPVHHPGDTNQLSGDSTGLEESGAGFCVDTPSNILDKL